MNDSPPVTPDVAATVDSIRAGVIDYLIAITELNAIQHLAAALLAFVLTLVVARLVVGLAARRLQHWAGDSEGLAPRLARRTHPATYFIFALYVGSRFLNLPDDPERLSPFAVLLIVVLLIQSIFWANVLIDQWVLNYRRRHLAEDAASVTMISALGFLFKLAVYVVALLLLLVNLGVNIGPLLATVGVAGIAIGLALQNVLSDLFASLSIVLDKPFVLGDFIIVGDQLGTVEEIGLKTTRLRALSGELLIFSNNDLLSSRIRNMKHLRERRIVFRFGVTYQTPPDKLAGIGAMIREIIEAQPDTRFDRAHFFKFGDSSLNCEVVYFILSPDYTLYMEIQQAINLELLRRFAAEGIDFAYPTRTLFVEHVGGGNGARGGQPIQTTEDIR